MTTMAGPRFFSLTTITRQTISSSSYQIPFFRFYKTTKTDSSTESSSFVAVRYYYHHHYHRAFHTISLSSLSSSSSRVFVSNPYFSFSLLTSSFSTTIPMDDDYKNRMTNFGVASKVDIKTIVDSTSDAIFLDVRSPTEVEENPLDMTSLIPRSLVHCHCTMQDTSKLIETASDILPNKNATILVFCGVGGRASKAKQALEGMGYTKVINIGGLKDMGYLL